MTRESIPRFDLYAELDVARSAAPATIEAAYRSMAKRHHPDLVVEADRAEAEARIKRINVARDWLTDPERRQRYDRALHRREALGEGAPGHARAARAARASEAGAGATIIEDDGTGAPAWTSFGPNAERVRRFLADLRELDETRGREIWYGRSSIDADDYGHAKRAAFAISRSRRLSEWLFARDAATAVVLGQLAGSPYAAEVAEILADVAGAIAIRDLLPGPLFDTLLEPWAWRESPLPAKTTSTAPGPMPRPTPPPVVIRATPPPPASVATPAPAAPGPISAKPPAPPTAPPRSTASPSPAAAVASAPRIRRPAVIALTASMAGLVVIATLVGASSLLGPRFAGEVAGIEASATPLATQPQVALATPAPTSSAPSPSPTPAATGPDAAQIADLQHGAWDTIRRLKLYATALNVRGAQRLLGDTAPGLQASGLGRATFPSVAAGDIAIAPDPSGLGWIATAGKDTLTSKDGVSWTFDYGERPLARFGRTSEHHLFWVSPSGQHEIVIRILSTTISRSSVAIVATWTYGNSGADAIYYVGTNLVVAGLTSDGSDVAGATSTALPLGSATLTTTFRLRAAVDPRTTLIADLQVVNVSGKRGFTAIDSTFDLGS